MPRGEYVRRVRGHLDTAIAHLQYDFARRHRYGWSDTTIGNVKHREIRARITDGMRDEVALIRHLRAGLARGEGQDDG